MNVVVTQTAINASVSDQNISVSAPQFSISASVVSSDIYASLSQTQINASVSQPPNVGVSLPQTPISVAVSSNGGGNNHDPVTLGIANGLSLSGQVLSLALSATGTVGALSAIDYNTFNGKLSDAPSNGLTYGRNSGAWVNITGTGGSSLPVVDTTAIVMGSSDPTKLLRFEVDGFSAGATRVLTPPNQNATIAVLEVAQTFTVNQIIDAHAAIGADAQIDVDYFGADIPMILHIAEEITAASSSTLLNVTGLGVDLVAMPASSASNTTYRAMGFTSYVPDSISQPISVLNGMFGQAWYDGSGALLVLNGVESYAFTGGSGTVTVINGLYSYSEFFGNGAITSAFAASYELWMTGASAITNVTGQRILFVKTGGTVTNAIGLDISNVNFATTTNIAIRTGAGLVLFGGIVNTTESYQVDSTKVIGNRVIDARIDDAINSGDATTDGVIDALRDAMIAHGLMAAA